MSIEVWETAYINLLLTREDSSQHLELYKELASGLAIGGKVYQYDAPGSYDVEFLIFGTTNQKDAASTLLKHLKDYNGTYEEFFDVDSVIESNVIRKLKIRKRQEFSK